MHRHQDGQLVEDVGELGGVRIRTPVVRRVLVVLRLLGRVDGAADDRHVVLADRQLLGGVVTVDDVRPRQLVPAGDGGLRAVARQVEPEAGLAGRSLITKNQPGSSLGVLAAPPQRVGA